MSAFQAEDGGSTPPTRSNLIAIAWQDRKLNCMDSTTQSLIQTLINHQSRFQKAQIDVSRHFCIKRLVNFLKSNQLLSSIIEELKAKVDNAVETEKAAKILVSGHLGADFENENNFILRSYFVLEACASGASSSVTHAGQAVSKEPTSATTCQSAFSDMYIEPLVAYLVNELQNNRTVLLALIQYKQKVEWFRREEFRKSIKNCKNKRIEEEVLNPDVYEFLHDRGIEFYIEPSSEQSKGRPDLITAQGDHPKLILDGKYLDDTDTAKSYIKSSFSQVYQYTYDFNRPSGYIVFFKNFKSDLKFSLPTTEQGLPIVTHNGKHIYFVLIDITDVKSPSKRGKIKAIDISESDLR